MIETKLITEELLQPFNHTGNDLASRAKALLAQQKTAWELLRNGYSSLETIQVRTFDFDGFSIKVQFNPGRIVSSAAKVDAKSIAERKCFLCYNHLPAEQRGLLFDDNYLVLCNPFPIFKEHFTLPHVDHRLQEIEYSFPVALDFSKELSKYYTVFYNGPKCGASAPDHLHFQAGEKYFMPIDSEYETIKGSHGSKIADNDGLKIYAVDKYLRKFFSFESKDKQKIVEAFSRLFGAFKQMSPEGEEPMMNVLFYYGNDEWRVIVFPREKHRPSYYFAEGDENILLSPASVDMGGVFITPLEKDFLKITKGNIADIFAQVTISESKFEKLKAALAQ